MFPSFLQDANRRGTIAIKKNFVPLKERDKILEARRELFTVIKSINEQRFFCKNGVVKFGVSRDIFFTGFEIERIFA